MGEEKEKIKAKGVEKKNGAGEKTAGGGKNGGGGGIGTILLKLDLHCEGCARKVRRSLRHFEGVEDVKADYSTGKLTVKGNVDPLWLREIVERKTKKKVELLSAQPKFDGGAGAGAGDKKSEEKVEKKAEEKKSDEKVEKRAEEHKADDKKPKKAQFNTEVVQLHCDGCARKVKRFIVKELTPYLKGKLKRNAVAVPPKKGDGPKKGNGSGGGGDNKKKKEVARDDGHGGGKKKDNESTVASKSREPKEKKPEVINKTEYNYVYNNPNTSYYAMPPPMYNQNYSNQDYGVTMHDQYGYYGHRTGYVPPPPPYLTTPRDHGYGHTTGYVSPQHLATLRDHGYGHSTGYVSPRHLAAPRDYSHGHTGYVPPPYTAPQYFSDENPNACSVM